jgi:hypothetical protein
MILLIIIIILITILVSLLCLPISIKVDTERNLYYVSMPLYFKATITESQKAWQFRFRVFLIPIKANFLEPRKKAKHKTERKKEKIKKTRKKISIKRIPIIVKKTINSFRVKNLSATIDTGDFPLNAQLIPVVSQLNRENISIYVNFENKNALNFRAVTYLYKLLWIIIRYIIF